MLSKFAPNVKQGVESAMNRGALLGYAMEDVKVTLLGGKIHETVTSDEANQQAFQMCAQQMIIDALTENAAQIQLLEPCMNLEIATDKAYMGMVLSDLSGARRAKIKGLGNVNGEQMIYAEVPLSEMIGYASYLRSMTHGNGHYFMEFERYDVLHREEQERLVRKMRGY
jgi:elongation factor G